MEVEILIAEVSNGPDDDRLFHILYDGTLIDEASFTVLGGDAEAVRNRVASEFEATPSLADGLRLAALALAGPDRSLSAGDLEVAVLDRNVEHRAFRRLTVDEVAELLGGEVGGSDQSGSGNGASDVEEIPLAATVTTDTGATDLSTAETDASAEAENDDEKAPEADSDDGT